jgi:ribosomal protein L17
MATFITSYGKITVYVPKEYKAYNSATHEIPETNDDDKIVITGLFATEDEDLAERMRRHPQFNKLFYEPGNDVLNIPKEEVSEELITLREEANFLGVDHKGLDENELRLKIKAKTEMLRKMLHPTIDEVEIKTTAKKEQTDEEALGELVEKTKPKKRKGNPEALEKARAALAAKRAEARKLKE